MGVSVSTNSGSRRRGRGRRGNLRPMSEINVTPFVDVILCLLIIFMVAAPLMRVGVEVDLPAVNAEALSSEEETPLEITITAAGNILIQSNDEQAATERSNLVPRLRAIMEERESTRIIVKADRTVSMETVLLLMNDLQLSGFRQLGFETSAGGPPLDDTDR
jgi:biopolymer transport protein TolR